MARAFVIRPFGMKKDSAGAEVDFERVHRELIGPALDAAGLAGSTTGEIIEAGNIREDMFALIIEADLVVCDVTVHNANVFYELGIRHGLRKRRAVLLRGEPVADAPPFDLLTDRYTPYDARDPAQSLQKLTDVLRATMLSERETDSPVFKMVPSLPEADPETIMVVPTDLSEEIARATAAGWAGWLRLLACEVQGLRFQWSALRTIGGAQWRIKDYEGAQATWERVRDVNPDDVGANLALANLYERAYRNEQRPELLEKSNRAIERVLNHGERISADEKAEALALQGRNQKTLWRAEFERHDDLASLREAATNRRLRTAYEAYRNAYLVDLNHFWSGLAALQMGAIALDLAKDPAWEFAFDDATEAQQYATRLKREVESLRATVDLAIDADLRRLARDDEKRVWAEIGVADLMFVTGEDPRRVRRAYGDAVPPGNFFACDAARGQLQLFESIGFRADLAAEVIAAIDAKIGKRPAAAADLHAIVFAGHQIDEPGRVPPRFPEDRVQGACVRIRQVLHELQTDGTRLRVFVSACPGADILCHEVCDDLGIDVVMCLPVPHERFAELAFGTKDAWRARYLALARKHPPLELSDRDGLSPWLEKAGFDLWERGNRWVLEMARTSGAERVSLVALWDGKETTTPRGGTAHMVQLAREAGTVDIRTIEVQKLT